MATCKKRIEQEGGKYLRRCEKSVGRISKRGVPLIFDGAVSVIILLRFRLQSRWRAWKIPVTVIFALLIRIYYKCTTSSYQIHLHYLFLVQICRKCSCIQILVWFWKPSNLFRSIFSSKSMSPIRNPRKMLENTSKSYQMNIFNFNMHRI